MPINTAFMGVADNLICSLKQFGITNIVVWALDASVHDHYIAHGYVSVFLAGSTSTTERVGANDDFYVGMLRGKPRVISLLLTAGYDVWYLDADHVAIADFTSVVAGVHADLFVSVKYSDSQPLKVSAQTLFLRSTNISIEFVAKWIDALAYSGGFDDLCALEFVLRSPNYRVVEMKRLNSTLVDNLSGSANVIVAFDPTRFVDSSLFDGTTTSWRTHLLIDPLLIHIKSLGKPEEYGLWFLDADGACQWKDPSLTLTMKLEGSADQHDVPRDMTLAMKVEGSADQHDKPMDMALAMKVEGSADQHDKPMDMTLAMKVKGSADQHDVPRDMTLAMKVKGSADQHDVPRDMTLAMKVEGSADEHVRPMDTLESRS